jgi:hypothetical protein
MAAPLTERELLIARTVFRYTLDAFSQVLDLGFDRGQVFYAMFNESDAVLNMRLGEKLGPMLDVAEATRADS